MLAILPAAFLLVSAAVQDRPVVDPTAVETPTIDATVDPADGTNRRTKRVTPLIAPVPFKNSQIGWGGVLMVGVIHHFDVDTTVKPSTGAVMGFASENGSWGVMALEVARFKSDAWRVRGMVGYMDLRYDFFGIGIDAGEEGRSVPLEQTFFPAGLAVLRRVAGPLYLGASIFRGETTVELRDSLGPGLPPVPNQARAVLLAPGVQGEFDTRDNDYWPARGSLAELKARFFSTTSGSSGSFQRYTLSWSWYNGLRGSDLVLATNVNACVAPGDAPFYGLCTLGFGRYNMRGYTQGRYRDHVGNVVQAELRGHRARFGAVVFGGFGQVAEKAGDIFESLLLPAGGVGARYQLTQKYPMHVRIDYAWGRDGGLLYFSVGEAF
jgi:surface antigen Omp85-like protein